MTVETLQAPTAARVVRSRIDLSGAVMALLAAALCLLVILPIGWLVVFAFTDRARNPTLANFHTLFTDPAFVEPLLTTLTIATSVSIICCLVAAPMGWIVARTDMPLRRRGAHPGDGLVRDAAVPRRDRLGAAGGAQQRPVEPAVPGGERRRA